MNNRDSFFEDEWNALSRKFLSYEFSIVQRYSLMNDHDSFLISEKNFKSSRMILHCVLNICYVKSSDKNSSCEWILDLLFLKS